MRSIIKFVLAITLVLACTSAKLRTQQSNLNANVNAMLGPLLGNGNVLGTATAIISPATGQVMAVVDPALNAVVNIALNGNLLSGVINLAGPIMGTASVALPQILKLTGGTTATVNVVLNASGQITAVLDPVLNAVIKLN